jgi:phenylalanyl-tRNA synthetase beta chain
MKISLEWLNEYVNLEGLSTGDISHALTMVGFEVEDIEKAGLPKLHKVVVGEIVAFDKHPNADRLSVCEVDVGGENPQTIVCGAKNFRLNDRVIAALPGAVLPGDFKIKKSKLRGVVSRGMLCSERELGIGEDHAGIAILESRPPVGTPINEVYPEPDTVFDIEITPNRPDALSHLGIARELAAWFKRELTYPGLKTNLVEAAAGSLIDKLESLDPEGCPHYRGYSLQGVAIDESPAWLRKRLKAVGLRPINNVVDATNYILHETGQPLHAFDVAKIRDTRISVRRAGKGEKIITLDGVERILEPTDLVIADGQRPLVVAGVMGSVDAEVDDETVDLFLESAWFDPVSVRRTSRRLALSTDSSYRFERGVDPKGAEYAALRCIDLILDLAGGEVIGPPLVTGEPPLVEREVDLSPHWVRERLGFDVSDPAIEACLRRLELDPVNTEDRDGKPLLRVSIPSFRQDLYRPIDLVEEVIRMHGSDRIPEGTVRATVTLREDDPVPVYQREATRLLTGKGFQETVHYTLRNEQETRLWGLENTVRELAIANPLASDASHLRISLVPGLLDCLRLNQARHNGAGRFFECGRVFVPHDGTVYELFSAAFVARQEGAEAWRHPDAPDYYFSSRIAQDLLGLAGVELNRWHIRGLSGDPVWQEGHAGQTGEPGAGYQARFGVLDLSLTARWDLESPVLAGEVLFLPEFLEKRGSRPSFRPFSHFPPALRDIAVVVPESMPAGKVEEIIDACACGALSEEMELESLRVFDIYRGEGLPEGHKSVACKLVFRHPERTLQDKEVNAVFQRVLDDLEERDSIRVRR